MYTPISGGKIADLTERPILLKQGLSVGIAYVSPVRKYIQSQSSSNSSSLRPGFDLGMRPPADFQGDNRRLNMAAVTTW